jgi:hypothetical protein
MARFNPLDHPILFRPALRITSSFWLEHVPFGMLAIDLIRPRLVVELGSHRGASYCAFCQAVSELRLETRCFAVDTWRGDAHVGEYGPEVLANLRAHHDPLYSSFSSLVQSSFDDALPLFADGSIDLLHIDGCHRYEAVKHDFECWLPKLSKRGVVMFHDTSMRVEDFGVWQLWEELVPKHPHFGFVHGCGLGILGVGKEWPAGMGQFFEATESERAGLEVFFAQLGAERRADWELSKIKRQLTRERREIERLSSELESIKARQQKLRASLPGRMALWWTRPDRMEALWRKGRHWLSPKTSGLKRPG